MHTRRLNPTTEFEVHYGRIANDEQLINKFDKFVNDFIDYTNAIKYKKHLLLLYISCYQFMRAESLRTDFCTTIDYYQNYFDKSCKYNGISEGDMLKLNEMFIWIVGRYLTLEDVEHSAYHAAIYNVMIGLEQTI